MEDNGFPRFSHSWTWTTRAGITETTTVRNNDYKEWILDKEAAVKEAPTAKFPDDDDNEVTENLGKCEKCGADNIRYKTGRVGCSKFCWKNK